MTVSVVSLWFAEIVLFVLTTLGMSTFRWEGENVRSMRWPSARTFRTSSRSSENKNSQNSHTLRKYLGKFGAGSDIGQILVFSRIRRQICSTTPINSYDCIILVRSMDFKSPFHRVVFITEGPRRPKSSQVQPKIFVTSQMLNFKLTH